LSTFDENRMNINNDKMFIILFGISLWKQFSKINKNNCKYLQLFLTDLEATKAWLATRVRHSFSSSCQR